MSNRFVHIPRLLITTLVGVLTFSSGMLISGDGARPIMLLSALLLLIGASIIAIISNSQAVRFAEQERERKSLEEARERARAIYELASTLGATLDYNRVLDAALNVGVLGLRDMTPSARMVSMVMLFQNDLLRVISSRRLTRQDEKVVVPGRAGLLGQALKNAEPVFGTDAHNDPELSYFVAFQDAKSLLVIPLRAGFSNYGVLVYGSTEPDAFSDEHLELFTAISSQATIALQNAVLYENLREEKERIVEVEEDARKKLARDLHDGPTQTISAIAMRVNYIRRLLEKKPDGAMEELAKVEELARQTTKEIRDMLFTLRPLVLETQGLSPALQQLGVKMKETYGLNVILQAQTGCDDLIDQHTQGVLFYIVEEAVNNARKHAKADHIYVRLYGRDRYFMTEIQDDGVGFDLSAVDANYDQRGSLGMINMRERAALVEGLINIDSEKGKGTKISVAIPLKESGRRPSNSNLSASRSTAVVARVNQSK